MGKPEADLRQRIFAWALARFNARYEQFASSYKQALFSGLAGTVLEIGPGTGANLRYLTPARCAGSAWSPTLSWSATSETKPID